MAVTGAPPGNLFVIAAPSGGGQDQPHARAAGTRARNPPVGVVHHAGAASGEQHDVDYHFVSADRFASLKSANEFLEHAHVHGNWYATSRAGSSRRSASARMSCWRSTGRVRRKSAP